MKSLARFRFFTYLCVRNNNKNDFIMNARQIYHYLLSHTDEELMRWYNDVMVDPYGDFRDQTIRHNNPSEVHDITSNYELEALVSIFGNERTRVSEDDAFLMLTGADFPHLITFNTFEDFLNGEGEYLCGYIEENPDFLDYLKREEK